MRVARLHAPGDVRLHDEPEPQPGPDAEILRVTAVGLCGSDRHWFVNGGIGDAVLSRPLVLGHEIVGVIETGSRVGQRVAVDPAVPCGHCELCLSDLAHLCRDLRFAGHGTTDGGLRQLMAWPRELLVALPDALDDAAASLLEPLGVALHAVDLAKVERGMTAGVFGCGPIGLLIIQLLRGRGVAVAIATDPMPTRRATASALGATDVRLPSFSETDNEQPTGSSWPSLNVAFEAAGEEGALDDAVAAVRPGGRVILVGIPETDTTSFRASTARRKGLTFLLSRRMRAADLFRAIELSERGQIELATLVSERYPLDLASEALGALVRRDGLKVVVEPAT